MTTWSEDDVTPWFDGSVKPARPGVYEREMRIVRDDGTVSTWAAAPPAAWDGSKWVRGDGSVSAYQPWEDDGADFRWRGLARDPSATAKPAKPAREPIAVDAWAVWSDDATLCHPLRDVVRTREHARAIAANGVGLRVIRVRVTEVI